jgi:hypothetical protein
MRIVQVQRDGERRVAIVDATYLRLLSGAGSASVYALANEALTRGEPLTAIAEKACGGERLDYDSVYEGSSEWRLLPSFDHPEDVSRCMVSGTGLTHKASAEHRSAMHSQSPAEVTDSLRMYRLGLEGGTPAPGKIGVPPEWFYKGNGAILRAHAEDLAVPSFAGDGGEEPEIAGAYIISAAGEPFRVGFTVANEFSDHKTERVNYLYLAPSKLRECAIGPELTIGEAAFEDVPGTVSITRGDKVIWTKQVWTGQKNMSHSVGNLEHHHFKYDAHRRPGDVHIHFFGADAFSFGAGLLLEDGDWMEVSFPPFGRPLRNRLAVSKNGERLITVRSI